LYPTYNNKEWLYKRLPLACGVGMPRPYTRVSREAFVLSELVVFAALGLPYLFLNVFFIFEIIFFIVDFLQFFFYCFLLLLCLYVCFFI